MLFVGVPRDTPPALSENSDPPKISQTTEQDGQAGNNSADEVAPGGFPAPKQQVRQHKRRCDRQADRIVIQERKDRDGREGDQPTALAMLPPSLIGVDRRHHGQDREREVAGSPEVHEQLWREGDDRHGEEVEARAFRYQPSQQCPEDPQAEQAAERVHDAVADCVVPGHGDPRSRQEEHDGG